MGFRFKRFDYVGGVDSWGSSSTPRTRSEAVLKDMAGWRGRCKRHSLKTNKEV